MCICACICVDTWKRVLCIWFQTFKQFQYALNFSSLLKIKMKNKKIRRKRHHQTSRFRKNTHTNAICTHIHLKWNETIQLNRRWIDWDEQRKTKSRGNNIDFIHKIIVFSLGLDKSSTSISNVRVRYRADDGQRSCHASNRKCFFSFLFFFCVCLCACCLSYFFYAHFISSVVFPPSFPLISTYFSK